jgi:predicted transcriptional regulator
MLGLTQAELAKQAEVSQSMIAKIEAGTLSPSYDKAQEIFEALESMEKEKSQKARDIMHKNVVVVKANDQIDIAIRLMKQKGLSQLPVFDKGHLIGLISERGIVDNLGIENLDSKRISAIMEDAPPAISEDSPVKVVSELLKYNLIVVVYKKAELVGVITKADLLKTI